MIYAVLCAAGILIGFLVGRAFPKKRMAKILTIPEIKRDMPKSKAIVIDMTEIDLGE